MKISEIKLVNDDITSFIRNMSLYEESLSKEAPDIWGLILSSLHKLSDISVFLEAACGETLNSELESIAKIYEVNNIDVSKSSSFKSRLNNVDPNVDFSKYN